MMDLSDGLASDLKHILDRSGVGAEVAVEQIPAAPGADVRMAACSGEDYKLLLTAAPEARAERRLLELRQRGQDAAFDTVLSDIIRRDEQDRNRAIAPLRQAEDAVLLDTTRLDRAGSLEALLAIVRERLPQ